MSMEKIKHMAWKQSKLFPDEVTFLIGSINGKDFFNIGRFHKVHGLVLYSTGKFKHLDVNALQQALKELQESDKF